MRSRQIGPQGHGRQFGEPNSRNRTEMNLAISLERNPPIMNLAFNNSNNQAIGRRRPQRSEKSPVRIVAVERPMEKNSPRSDRSLRARGRKKKKNLREKRLQSAAMRFHLGRTAGGHRHYRHFDRAFAAGDPSRPGKSARRMQCMRATLANRHCNSELRRNFRKRFPALYHRHAVVIQLSHFHSALHGR